MIEEIAEKIVRDQIRHPYRYIIVFLILTLLIFPGILKLVSNVEPSLEKVLPSDIQEVKTMNNMRAQFGADMVYVLAHIEGPVTDVRDFKVLNYLDALSEKLRTDENILEVTSLADIVISDYGLIPNSNEKIKEILRLDPSTPSYTNYDYSFAVIRIKSDTGSSAQLIDKVINSIRVDIDSIETINPGLRFEITGFNAIDKATFNVIMSDFMNITFVSLILVGLVVFFTFRSFVKGTIPLIVVFIALLWTFGIAGYLNLTITVVSMVAAAMILGLGIDFGIHVVHSYYERRKNERPKHAMIETMKELLLAMLGASLTTISGFLALLFGILPAMKTLGIILAIGILNTLLSAVLVLPVIIYLYDTKYGGI